MNPITNIKNQNKMNQRELDLGIAGDLGKSWHQKYKDSAWIYIGGLPYELTEGDIIAVFSQYGEVMNINLIRDHKTGKSRGFCFLCYKDQRSTILAVDNFNGITLLKRMLRVDHVEEYKVPKYREDADEETKRLWEQGCAPKPIFIPAPDEKAIKKQKKREKKEKERLLGLKGVEPELLKRRKEMKKEAKQKKKEEKRKKKLAKKMAKLRAEAEARGEKWDAGAMMDVKIEEDEYGENEHFQFGEKHEAKEESKHNPRPDFEKADWRDVDMWKIMREREKAEKAARGESTAPWEEGEHYLPTRFNRDKN